MKKIILFTVSLCLAISAISQDITGSWNGILDVGAAKLPLVINISEKDGKFSATMDSPSQGAKGIPVNTVVFENLKLSFMITALSAKYEGLVKNDSIFGTFTQSGMSFPLNFSRMNAPIITNKPQDPKPPYPYNSEDVRFENKKAGITLAGTLTLPKEGQKFSAVVLVTGSGQQNRDEEVLGHRPFLVLADYLTRNGIAVLRYDDRGVAESTGDYKSATFDDFTTDAAAAVAYLKTRKEINPKKIGVAGHSEGGTIAFLLASEKNSDLAFIVSLAGMAIPGDSLLQMQRYLIGKTAGVSDKDIAQNEELVRLVDSISHAHSDDFILQNMENIIDNLLPDSLKNNDAIKAVFKQGFQQMMNAEMKSLMNCNPAQALKNIQCPVLALNGEKDLQVPADVNLNRVKTLVKSPVTVKKYPSLNHLFQHCTTGLPAEYGVIEETISPEVLKDIADWIKKR